MTLKSVRSKRREVTMGDQIRYVRARTVFFHAFVLWLVQWDPTESRISSIIYLCWHRITNLMWELLMLIDPTQFKKYFLTTLPYINFQVKVLFQILCSTREPIFTIQREFWGFFHINHCKHSEINHRINSNLKNWGGRQGSDQTLETQNLERS